MSAPKKKDDKDPQDFKEVRIGPLGGRVYNDGRVILGASVYDNAQTEKVKMEVEITTDHQTARTFLEHMIGLIKTAQGCY